VPHDMYAIPRDSYGGALTVTDVGLSVGPVRRDDEGRWFWTVTLVDPDTDRPAALDYCTDRRGDGLWTGRDQSGTQLAGHAQWTLRDVSGTTRRQRVLRAMIHRHY
jgi:hypothetical protein